MDNYYIIGTKLGGNRDIMPYIIEKQAIAIGFCYHLDLTKFYNNVGELRNFLHINGEKNPKDVAQIKRFMSLKEGDIIALKSSGSPIGKTPCLKIIGYAIVVKRNGAVYQYEPHINPNNPRHWVNVEFLEFNLEKIFELGYGQTVHHLTRIEHIAQIFGLYSEFKTIRKTETSNSFAGVQQKNTNEIFVNISATYVKKAIHNNIQQSLYEKWVNLLGRENVKMEENFVDMIVTKNGVTELIEIKPYETATQCIREGLGQLLSYYHKHYLNIPNIELVIIGGKEPNVEDANFIDFIKTTLNINFRYDSWERLSKE